MMCFMQNAITDNYFTPHNSATKIYYTFKPGLNHTAPIMLWAHGWGQSSTALAQLSNSLLWRGSQICVDFPGFGKSDPPDSTWGVPEYSAAIIELLQHLALPKPIVWVGHSFGCRVGMLIATKTPTLIEKLCLLGCPGVPYQRSLKQRVRLKFIRWIVRCINWLPIPVTIKNRWKNYYGSADYRAAGQLRQTFVKVVNQDLSQYAKEIKQPVLLLCGANDTETPVQQAEAIHKLMPNAKLTILAGQDHYSMLGVGHQQAVNILYDFLMEYK